MNVLLTSVGRRAYMVKYFQTALAGEGKVHVCNSDDKTVAFQYADKSIISPLIYSDEYVPFLLNYCKKNKIDILISLFDIDCMVLSKNKDKFLEVGTHVIVSDEKIVSVCNDKWKTYRFLKNNGFNVPKTYLTLEDVLNALDCGEIKFPIIVKPRFGCGSIAMSIAEDEMSLLYYYRRNTRVINKTYLKYESAAVKEKIIYQQCLEGQEYGADIINDLNGRFETVIIKKKIAMRAGETDIAEIVKESVVFDELKRLSIITKHIANMDCDIFMVDGKPYILEMNARFGGGYPFSHVAGCDLPRTIIDWVKGKKTDKSLLAVNEIGKIFKEIVLTSMEK